MKAEFECRRGDDRAVVQLVVQVALACLHLAVRFVWIDELHATNGHLNRGGFAFGLFCGIDERRLEGRGVRCPGNNWPRNKYSQRARNGEGSLSTCSYSCT